MAIDADVIAGAALSTAALALVAACVTQTHLIGSAAAIAADQRILAACVADACLAIWTARPRAGLVCRATDFAVDAALVPRAAVTIAGTLGRAALALQAVLGAGTADAITEC